MMEISVTVIITTTKLPTDAPAIIVAELKESDAAIVPAIQDNGIRNIDALSVVQHETLRAKIIYGYSLWTCTTQLIHSWRI